MVSQIQYDALESCLIPIRQDLMQRQSNSGKFFHNIFSHVGQISGVTLYLDPWKFNIFRFFKLLVQETSFQKVISHPEFTYPNVKQ